MENKTETTEYQAINPTEGTIEFVESVPANAVEIGGYTIYAEPAKTTLWYQVKRFVYNNRFMLGYGLGTAVTGSLVWFVYAVTQ